MIAATGRIRTSAARRMSLTTMASLWSQRSTNVPAIGLSSRFGSVAAKKTSPVANAEPVGHHNDRNQCKLIESIAEERDELSGPHRREGPVEGEPDVGMLADPDSDPRFEGDRGGCCTARSECCGGGSCRQRRCGGRGHGRYARGDGRRSSRR